VGSRRPAGLAADNTRKTQATWLGRKGIEKMVRTHTVRRPHEGWSIPQASERWVGWSAKVQELSGSEVAGAAIFP
jgi:hypothetical protein